MKYQWSTVLPYWFNTYVLRRKALVEPQLYKFNSDESQGSTGDELDEIKTV